MHLKLQQVLLLLLLLAASVAAAANPCSDLNTDGANLAGPRLYENCVVSAKTINVDQATFHNVQWTGGGLGLLSSVNVNVTLDGCTMTGMSGVLNRTSNNAIRNVTLTVVDSTIVATSGDIMTFSGALTSANDVTMTVTRSTLKSAAGSSAGFHLPSSAQLTIANITISAAFSHVEATVTSMGLANSGGSIEADDVELRADSSNITVVGTGGRRAALGVGGAGTLRMRSFHIKGYNSTVYCGRSSVMSAMGWSMNIGSIAANDTSVNATLCNVTMRTSSNYLGCVGWGSSGATTLLRAHAIADRTVLVVTINTVAAVGVLGQPLTAKHTSLTSIASTITVTGFSSVAVGWIGLSNGAVDVQNSTALIDSSAVLVSGTNNLGSLCVIGGGSNFIAKGVELRAVSSTIIAKATGATVVSGGWLASGTSLTVEDFSLSASDSEVTAQITGNSAGAIAMGGLSTRSSCLSLVTSVRNVSILSHNTVVLSTESAFDIAALCQLTSDRYRAELPMNVSEWVVDVRGGSVKAEREAPHGRCFGNLANYSTASRRSSVRDVTLNCSRYSVMTPAYRSIFASGLSVLSDVKPFGWATVSTSLSDTHSLAATATHSRTKTAVASPSTSVSASASHSAGPSGTLTASRSRTASRSATRSPPDTESGTRSWPRSRSTSRSNFLDTSRSRSKSASHTVPWTDASTIPPTNAPTTAAPTTNAPTTNTPLTNTPTTDASTTNTPTEAPTDQSTLSPTGSRVEVPTGSPATATPSTLGPTPPAPGRDNETLGGDAVESESRARLSAGGIAGVVVAAVFAATMFVIGALAVIVRRRLRLRASPREPTDHSGATDDAVP